jgi:hypothetical protein
MSIQEETALSKRYVTLVGGDISRLEGLVNINKQGIKANKDDIATLNTDFTALDARVVTLETYQTNTLKRLDKAVSS